MGIASCILILFSGVFFFKSEQTILNTIEKRNLNDSTALLKDREKAEIRTMLDNINFNTKMLSNIAGQFIFNFDTEGLESVLTSFMNIQGIMAIQVTDISPKPFRAIWKDKKEGIRFDRELPPEFSKDLFSNFQADSFYEEEITGGVTVYYTDAHIKEELARIRQRTLSDQKEFQKTVQLLVNKFMKQGVGLMFIIVVIIVFISWLLGRSLARSITDPIKNTIEGLTLGSKEVNHVSEKIQTASGQIADGANTLATNLQESTASIIEIAAKTEQNAKNAGMADSLSNNVHEIAEKGGQSINQMSRVIGKIKESSDETTQIVKTIDEIAFQTNLLALNAAVEAARAGDAGVSFAVVAKEVRNLAQRSAEEAQNTSSLIDVSRNNAEDGVMVAGAVETNLNEIVEGIRQVTQLFKTVSEASAKQALGVKAVNKALEEMDTVAQNNAGYAHESVTIAGELSKEAEKLNKMVDILAGIVGQG
jgi:methyl-accepting chemotaxis protein